MYLWKYWRDTRIAFAASMVGIAVLLALVLRTPAEIVVNGRPLAVGQLSAILPVALFLQAFPVAFIAWVFGSFGTGRDLGERSGSFLFSRPASRAFFVWSDWGFGMAQLLAIVVLLNLVIGFLIHRLIIAAGDPLHGSLLFANQPVALASVVCLNIGAALLLAGLVFGLTYFSTILLRNSKGVMLAAGVLLGYIILVVVVKHYWPTVDLPHIIPPEFASPGSTSQVFADHLGLSMAIRAAVILLFPFAAQVVLQKTDL